MQTHKIGRIGSVGSVMVSARARARGSRSGLSATRISQFAPSRPAAQTHPQKNHTNSRRATLKLYENLRVQRRLFVIPRRNNAVAISHAFQVF